MEPSWNPCGILPQNHPGPPRTLAEPGGTLVEPSWTLTSGPPRTTPEPIWAETPKLSAVRGEKQTEVVARIQAIPCIHSFVLVALLWFLFVPDAHIQLGKFAILPRCHLNTKQFSWQKERVVPNVQNCMDAAAKHALHHQPFSCGTPTELNFRVCDLFQVWYGRQAKSNQKLCFVYGKPACPPLAASSFPEREYLWQKKTKSRHTERGICVLAADMSPLQTKLSFLPLQPNVCVTKSYQAS